MEAEEPHFQHSLRQLEMLAAHPAADIRVSVETQQGMRSKLQELGLDGQDTTAQELYAVLGERLKADERRFRERIGLDGMNGQWASDIILQVLRAVSEVIEPKTCFALKASVAKKMLRAQQPKRVMKALGYRSAESMFKHESAAALFAAAALVESAAWHKRLFASYSKLKATDFELRDIILEQPTSRRWQELAAQSVGESRRYVYGFKELGAVVVLPLPNVQPQLIALMTATLTVQAVNEIRVASSYLRLHQMKSGFGATVSQVVLGGVLVSAEVLGRPITWDMLHQFFGRLQHVIQANIFEPLLHREELAWLSAEEVLARIEPSLEFWRETDHVGLQDGQGRPLTCNFTDMLLSHANGVSFEQRLTHHFKQALHTELLLRYLSGEGPRQALLINLQTKLAPEMATIE